MGEAPDWYLTLRAAKYLGVAPWDLAERPVWWQEIALAAEKAETAAANSRSKTKRGAE
jgi:hypothetical protein